MLINFIFISLFGMLGVLCRFTIDTWALRLNFIFPIATFIINIAGSFLAGYISQKSYAYDSLRLGIIIGFCGGFTTMSGFSLQLVDQINSGKMLQALIYGLGTPILCVFSVMLGIFISRYI